MFTVTGPRHFVTRSPPPLQVLEIFRKTNFSKAAQGRQQGGHTQSRAGPAPPEGAARPDHPPASPEEGQRASQWETSPAGDWAQRAWQSATRVGHGKVLLGSCPLLCRPDPGWHPSGAA